MSDQRNYFTDSAEQARNARIRNMSPFMLAMTGSVDQRAALDASDRMWAELDSIARSADRRADS
jgi:hypothetical protein